MSDLISDSYFFLVYSVLDLGNNTITTTVATCPIQ